MAKKVAAIAAAIGLVGIIILLGGRGRLPSPEGDVVMGAIIAEHKDPHLQRPISNATITVDSGAGIGTGTSEVSGLFRVQMDAALFADETLSITVTHPDYNPFTITAAARERLHVLRLSPKVVVEDAGERAMAIRNVRVRYATRSASTTTIGAAVRTFDVDNAGNVECAGRPPCSPDGKWKATVRSFELDAGEPQKHIRNVRVSCIAGPCPFTQVEQDRSSRDGRSITVTVRNWSDPVTYLVEAEVATTMENEMVRHAYPVTFGRSMNFTLPAEANGVSIEAEVNGAEIVFPLGPELRLSWATCRFETAKDDAKQFRCELRAGYRFES